MMISMKKSPPGDREDAGEPSMFICRDCKSASPVRSLITVDPLHMQCPLCLYVFFLRNG
jgi:hypothetical protein